MIRLAPLLCLCLVPGAAAAKSKYTKTRTIKAGQKNNEWRRTQCKRKRLPKGVKKQRWVEGQYKAPNGEKWDRGQVCEMHLDDGRVLWHDGSSGEAPGKAPKVKREKADRPWGEVFHEGAVIHDHCYHHNPITYGLTQDDCDRQLEQEMDAVCARRYAKNKKGMRKCRRASKVMYAAVRLAGKKHFASFNTRTEYYDIYPGKEVGATAGKCPIRMKRIGEHKGKQLCRGLKIRKRLCKKRGGKVMGKGKAKDCILDRGTWYKARALK